MRHSTILSIALGVVAMVGVATSALADDRTIPLSKDGALLEKPRTVTSKVICDEDYNEI